MTEEIRPPNPRHNTECSEVGHEELFEISRVRNMYVLHNTKTNEVLHASPEKVKLHFRNGRAFISKEDGSTVWCKQLMSWSVWKIAGREFVCKGHDNDEVERVWLCDFQKRKQALYIREAGRCDGSLANTVDEWKYLMEFTDIARTQRYV